MANTGFDKNQYLATYGSTLEFIILITRELYNHPDAPEVTIVGKETITRNEALAFIKTYLENNNADADLMAEFLNENTSLHQRLNLIQTYLVHQKHELQVSTVARENVLDSYQEFLRSRETLVSQYPSSLQDALGKFRQQVAEYNRNLTYLNQGLYGETDAEKLAARQRLQQILPPEDILSDVEITQLEEKIVKVLPTIAAQLPLKDEPLETAIYTSLKEIAKGDTLLETFLAYNAAPKQQEILNQTMIAAIDKVASKSGIKIGDLQAQQLELTRTVRSLSLTRQQVEGILFQKLTTQGGLDQKTAQSFVQTLLNESVKTAYTQGTPLSASTLIEKALGKTKLQLNDTQRQLLVGLAKPLFPDIELHQQTQILEARQRGFGYRTFLPFLPAEVRLAIATGIDPAAVEVNYRSEIKDLLKSTKASSLQEAWTQESAKASPDISLLHKIRLLQDNQYQRQILKSKVAFSRNPIRWIQYASHKTTSFVAHSVNKYRRLESQAWELWFKFENNLPHNKIVDWWVRKEEYLSKTKWGWITNPVKKGLDSWGGYKRKITLNILSRYEGSTSFRGRAVYRMAALYRKGYYSLNGFVQEASIYAVSKAYQWGKTAVKKLIGKAIKKVAAWAMKKIAAWGLEATVTAISSAAAPVVGAIAIAVEVISLAIDAAKILWKNKETILKYATYAYAAVQGIIYAIKILIVQFLSQFGAALIGAAVGWMVGGPLGALVGFGLGLLAPKLAAILSSLATTAGAFFSSIGAAISAAVTSGVSTLFMAAGAAITSVSLFWTMTMVTAQLPLQEEHSSGFAPGQWNIIDPGTGEPISCKPGPFPLPGSAPNTSPISKRAWQIVSDLEQGFWCYWNRSPNTGKYPPTYPELFNEEMFKSDPNPGYPGPISQCGSCLFWCTQLIQKAYRESGKSPPNSLNSQTMLDTWTGQVVKGSDATPSNIVAGSVIFFHVSGGPNRVNHVAIVTGVSSDSVAFVQSNSPSKTGSLTFNVGKGVQNPPGIEVAAFGLP